MQTLRILAIGDVVGPAAVETLQRNLWNLRKEYHADFVITNAENASVGNGLDVASAKNILFSGTDVITSGNHIWQKRELYAFLNNSEQVIRPANYPSSCPGSGYTISDCQGYKILVMNVLGNIFMEPLDNPFAVIDRILEREKGRYDFAALDIHAEATSEKIAMAKYFDGRIQILFGTHTHVQTADITVLPHGSGYITDLGMTGPDDGVLGIRTDIIIEKLRTKMPVRFELAQGDISLHGACFTLDTGTGRVTDAELVRKTYPHKS